MKDQKFPLRPASREEAGHFYSNDERDEVLGTVGHLRMDFGSGGKGFYHTWWPHNEDRFNTPEFKEALQEFVDAMRQSGPLKNLAAMNTYCWHNGGEIAENDRVYGFVAETEHYRFCLRCTPRPGDYQGYLYCYDLRQQEMARQEKLVGRVTYASGEQQEFCDPQRYLQTIREELPYRNTTGFRYETLTDDPAVKKAVDDILLDVAGEENPRRTCNYAEPGSDFKEVYRKGEMFCFARPSAPVVLEVRKGFFDDPSYDNDKTTILNLPASDADIWRAVGEVDAASLDECAFRCIDCEIPSLRDAVDDAIEQEGGIGMASEFAANLAQKKQSWHEADWVKYKALLSVAGCPSLQDAIQLMHGLDDYDLRPDVAATWDYAEVVLREKYPDLPEELFQTPQAAMVGRQMLEENHAAITDYGLFRRKDNGQLPVFQREPQAMDSPQMGGM